MLLTVVQRISVRLPSYGPVIRIVADIYVSVVVEVACMPILIIPHSELILGSSVVRCLSMDARKRKERL